MTSARAEAPTVHGETDIALPIASAEAAGLRYVNDERSGLHRVRTGKSLRNGKRSTPDFEYRDSHGKRVRAETTLLRIRKLAIPPAWENVWICPEANGHLQATGRDARGRKQYRYHPRWREERDSTKYARMMDFGRALPHVRRRVEADLHLPGLPRRKVLATVVKLLETTFIRVGNEEYARSNRSFGLTTLETRHVDIHSADVRFHFRGKSGVYHEVLVHDPRIACIVRKCRDLPGEELFQYLDEEGDAASIDSTDVNEYIREVSGHDFTAKDFRTWAGTVLAANALRDLRNGHAERRAAGKQARMAHGQAHARARGREKAAVAHPNIAARIVQSKVSRRPNNKDVTRAIASVAERLGNTPSVCRKCYVHPEIIAAYLDGVSIPASKDIGAGRARATARLRPDEQAVLALLRRRLAETHAGTRLADQLKRSLRRPRHQRTTRAAARSGARANQSTAPRGTRRAGRTTGGPGRPHPPPRSSRAKTAEATSQTSGRV